VVITGLYWGWSCLLFPIALSPFLFGLLPARWVLVPVLLALIAGLGYRFHLRITHDLISLKTSILGFRVSQETFPTDTAVVQFGFDWDRINPPDVEIGSHSLGDETNAIPLLNTIMAAIAHVKGDVDSELAHLRLASPVTQAPGKSPIAAEEAVKVIERYQKMGLEVLMVRGWTLEGAQRVGLYVISEKCIRVFDAYVRTDEIPTLEAMRPTPAHDDEMAFTTRKRFVWTAAPFRLWQGGTPIARLYPGTLWTIKGGEIPRDRIVSVRGWLSEGWTKMGVDVETNDGEKKHVAVGLNPGPCLDVLYDGIDLMFDVEWVESISRILAEELDVPCIDDNLSSS